MEKHMDMTGFCQTEIWTSEQGDCNGLIKMFGQDDCEYDTDIYKK